MSSKNVHSSFKKIKNIVINITLLIIYLHKILVIIIIIISIYLLSKMSTTLVYADKTILTISLIKKILLEII